MRTFLTERALVLLCGVGSALAGCDDGDHKSASDAGMDGGDSEAGENEGDAAMRADASDAARDARADAGDAQPADPYQCVPGLPDGSVPKGEGCCDGLGICLELGDDAGAQVAYGDCDAKQNLRCVPNASLGADAGMVDAGDAAAGDAAVPLATCRVLLAGADAGDPDYEGRCVPECLTRGVSGLAQAACDDGYICVPCYSPVTAQDTGACRNAGDQPREPAPSGFGECGDALGYCIASGLAGTTSNLPQLSCAAGELCAPKQRVIAPDSCFARCDSIAGAGACIAAFLVPEMSRSFLQQGSCAMGELCSPCVNPLDNTRTGACD